MTTVILGRAAFCGMVGPRVGRGALLPARGSGGRERPQDIAPPAVPGPGPCGYFATMSGFFSLAKRMGRHWGLLVLALVFATISAGGLGAGLLSIKPILDNVLGRR